MATKALDQSVPFDDLLSYVPLELVAPLRPHVTGGHASLFRYSVADEKALIDLGAYNSSSDTNYAWPNQPSGSLVDVDYAKLWIEGAKLRYYSDAVSAGDTIAPVASYSNRVRAAATRFKSNAAGARSASLYDRDVTPGDVVYLQGNGAELWTKVDSLVAEVVAASVNGTATADSGNHAGQVGSSSISQTAGTVNDVTATRNVNAYNALEDGAVNEVYTITVIQSASTPGDATSARLSVTSSSGLDNQASVTPSIYGRPTPIGTRGALVTFSRTSSDLVLGQTWTLTIAQAFTAITATAAGTFTGPKDLTYVVTVTKGGVAGATNPAANPSVQATANATGGGASGGLLPAGTYYIAYTFVTTEGETTVGSSESAQLTVGATNIPRVTLPSLPTGVVGINVYLTNTNGGTGTQRLYRRNVITTTTDLETAAYDGGTYANSSPPPATSTAAVVNPQITATDTTGFDSSGPTTVPGGLSAAVGSYGATITFSAASLRAGDKYRVVCTAASDGAIQTIVLEDNMNATLLAAADCTLKLYIQKNAVVPRQRLESPPNVNWVAAADQLTVKGAMTMFDSTWTNGGVQVALPVESGTLYAEYRAWLATHTGKVSLLVSRDDLEAALGTEDPDNPLCYAVGKALVNSNGQGVYYTAVADPDDTELWDEVLDILDRQQDVYGLVPLTDDDTVLEAYKEHCEAQSADDVGFPRVVWSALRPQVTFVVVDESTTSDEEVAMGTLADNPSQSGTQYTLLACTSTNAKFVTNGVRAGDVVRYLYAIDGFGETTYDEFVVSSVVNEDTLVLQTGHTAAVSTPQRFEIWRDRTRTEVAEALAAEIVAGKSMRWIPVLPESMLDGTVAVDGFYLCAALAGMAGGVPPHQSLRNLTLSGFTSLGATYNNGQLNTVETAGCTTVAIDGAGSVFVRQARTADQTSIATGEEAAVRSLDCVHLVLSDMVRALYGVTNVVGGSLNTGAAVIVQAKLTDRLQQLASTRIDRLGGIIVSGSVTGVAASETSADALTVTVDVVRPFALGAATITITASAS